jgi:NAD-dependent DNA ligase
MNIQETIKNLRQWSKEYAEGNPSVPDQVWDETVEKLREEAPDCEFFKKAVSEPTPSSTRKEKLPQPMLSLDKVKQVEKLEEWLGSVVGEGWKDTWLVITPKFDGISAIHVGKKWWSRGDGYVGEIMDEQCAHLNESEWDSENFSMMRGELIITQEDWEKNEEYFKSLNYKNPRNTVAGWKNGGFKEGIRYNLMSYVPYNLFTKDGTPLSKSEQMERLSVIRGVDLPYRKVKWGDKTLGEVEEFLLALFQEWSRVYPIDGLVVDIEDPQYRMGTEANGNPRYARAYKHPSFNERKWTEVVGVIREVNRFGVVTPVLQVKPVDISGATVSRVNGISSSYLSDWMIYEGCPIMIRRSGEVIPQMVQVGSVIIPFLDEFENEVYYRQVYGWAVEARKEEAKDSFALVQKLMDQMSVCPYCGEPLKWDKKLVNQVCCNPKCEEVNFQKVYDFFKILKFEGFKEKTFRQLYKMGKTHWRMIMEVTKDDLLRLDKFGEKSADKFLEQVRKLREDGIPTERLLHASGYFPGLGEKTLKVILLGIHDTVPKDRNVTLEDLVKIDGVSSITANVYLNGISKVCLEPYSSYMVIVPPYGDKKKEGKYSDLKVVFSGFRDAQLKHLIEEEGGEVLDNISKNTSILVVKEVGKMTSKVAAAMKIGVEVISLKDFKERFI